MDGVLSMLEKTGRGCFINKCCLNSFMYVDDLILLSISVSDIQFLLDKCAFVFDSLDLQINVTKSCCLRIGLRYRAICSPITLNNSPLDWVLEAKYLGIRFRGGAKLTCSWHESRCNFYRTINNLLGVLGNNPSVAVILSLFQSTCVPLLSYGLCSFSLSVADLNSFSFAYNNIFGKNFRSYDKSVISQCQFFCSCLPFNALYDLQRYRFLVNYLSAAPFNASNPFLSPDMTELTNIANKYGFTPSDSKSCLKFKIWKFVENEIVFVTNR